MNDSLRGDSPIVESTRTRIVDKYLREASGIPESKITNVIEKCSLILGVSVSTIDRWRRDDCIPIASHIVGIITLINAKRPTGEKCKLKDIAILCNYMGEFRT